MCVTAPEAPAPPPRHSHACEPVGLPGPKLVVHTLSPGRPRPSSPHNFSVHHGAVGAGVGIDGDSLGLSLGELEGLEVGTAEGLMLGELLGLVDGEPLGPIDGVALGLALGLALGNTVGDCDGISVGPSVGATVGASVHIRPNWSPSGTRHSVSSGTVSAASHRLYSGSVVR